jgi:putative tryptophan/tyrosine transport system substrate-binding protein
VIRSRLAEYGMKFDRLRRRDLITLLGGAAAMWPRVASAQMPKKIPRLCFLTFDPMTTVPTRFAAFFEGMRNLGYVNGQSISIDFLSAEEQSDRFPALAAECVRLKADLIVGTSTPAVQAAKQATRTIPILFPGLGDPVGTGLVDSLAQPGGNVTGMSVMFPELAAKRLTLLTQAVPGMSRVLVLSYLTDPIAQLQVQALQNTARALGVTLNVQDIRTGGDLPAAFERGAKESPEGLITTAASIFVVIGAQVTELAARHRLPAMYHNLLQVTDHGGLMAYASDANDVYRRAAAYADRILKGAKPADLPVQQPTTFEFVINLKTAKTLGLILPPGVVALADRVIE